MVLKNQKNIRWCKTCNKPATTNPCLTAMHEVVTVQHRLAAKHNARILRVATLLMERKLLTEEEIPQLGAKLAVTRG